jgi:hypothetical protein
MKVEIESTSEIVELNGVPARVWKGYTEGGIAVTCFVTRVAVRDNLPPGHYEQFERELKEQPPPSGERSWPLRMVL